MQIQRLSLAEGAREATGVAVIIDVFRAFTCEPLMLHLGARRLILEGDPQRCLATGAMPSSSANTMNCPCPALI